MEHLRLRFVATEAGRVEIHFAEPVEKLSMSVIEAQHFLAVLKEIERMAYDVLCDDAAPKGHP